MSGRIRRYAAASLAVGLAGGLLLVAPAAAGSHGGRHHGGGEPGGDTVRFATFNASLNRGTDGQLVRDLSTTADQQAGTVAEIIRVRLP